MGVVISKAANALSRNTCSQQRIGRAKCNGALALEKTLSTACLIAKMWTCNKCKQSLINIKPSGKNRIVFSKSQAFG